MRIVLSSVLLSLALSGCASAGSGGGSRNPNLISSEELRQAESDGSSALRVIQRLRPRWLQTRGASSFDNPASPAMVIVNGAPYGELDTLVNMYVSEIEELRFMNARDATTRFGTGYIGGAILVSVRQGR